MARDRREKIHKQLTAMNEKKRKNELMKQEQRKIQLQEIAAKEQYRKEKREKTYANRRN